MALCSHLLRKKPGAARVFFVITKETRNLRNFP
jgi:hypothetical protein